MATQILLQVASLGAAVLSAAEVAEDDFWQGYRQGDSFFTRPNSAVKELKAEELDAAMNAHGSPWIVEFYAPWCPHCVHSAPIWNQVAGESKDAAMFGSVNCVEHEETCTSVGITGFPTVRAYNCPLQKNIEQVGFDEKMELVTLVKRCTGKTQATQELDSQPSPSGDSQPSPSEASSFPMSKEEPANPFSATGRLIDAEVSLLFSLRQGTLLAAAGGNSTDATLGGEGLKELQLWLKFLADVFPSQHGRRIISHFYDVAASTDSLDRDIWLATLESKPFDMVPSAAAQRPDEYWQYCGGYSCGLWSLFHILLATIAGGQSESLGSQPRASEALTRIRGFVSKFFGCESCVKHFLETYDACMASNCVDRSDATSASLWLWEVHNNVTMRVAVERGLEIPDPWPSKSMCPQCRPAKGGYEAQAVLWNTAEVSRYLFENYGQQRAPSASIASRLSKKFFTQWSTPWLQNMPCTRTDVLALVGVTIFVFSNCVWPFMKFSKLLDPQHSIASNYDEESCCDQQKLQRLILDGF